MFADKITFEDLLIRVLPGGFIVVLAFLVSDVSSSLNSNLDFLYSFFFLCVAFIVGEVLQTIANGLVFVPNIFFKGYKPSEIFLYKNNPVVRSEKMRKKLLEKLDLQDFEKEVFKKDYKDLPFVCRKRNQLRDLPQSAFWTLYSKVEDDEKIKRSNINYLFVRVIMVDFLLAYVYLALHGYVGYSIVAFGAFMMFLWRYRGLARGLVMKSVLVYIK